MSPKTSPDPLLPPYPSSTPLSSARWLRQSFPFFPPFSFVVVVVVVVLSFAPTISAEYFTTANSSRTLHFAVWNGNEPNEFINISLIQEVPVSPYRHYDLQRIRDCIQTESGRVQCRIKPSECKTIEEQGPATTRAPKLRTEVSIFFTIVPLCEISEGPSNDWVSLMVRIACKSQTKISCKRAIPSTVPTPSPTPLSRKDQPADEIPPPVFCYSDVIDARSSSQFDATTGARSGLYRRYDLSEFVSSIQFNNDSFAPQTVDVHFGRIHTISLFSLFTSKSGFGINDGPSKFVLQGCDVDDCYIPEASSNSSSSSPWEDIHEVNSNVFSSTTEKKEFYIPRRKRKEFRVYRLKMESAGWKDAGQPWGYFALRQLRFCGFTE